MMICHQDYSIDGREMKYEHEAQVGITLLKIFCFLKNRAGMAESE